MYATKAWNSPGNAVVTARRAGRRKIRRRHVAARFRRERHHSRSRTIICGAAERRTGLCRRSRANVSRGHAALPAGALRHRTRRSVRLGGASIGFCHLPRLPGQVGSFAGGPIASGFGDRVRKAASYLLVDSISQAERSARSGPSPVRTRLRRALRNC